jgi:dihydropteroate synthase
MGFDLPANRVAIMGILNVTPDSFSDGGLYFDPNAAIEHGRRLWLDGADIIDVGGESTRPGASEIDAAEECRRVIPVVAALAQEGIPVSIDTRKSIVAREALEAGAIIVNDVSALRDPAMIGVCADAKSTVCLMHMRGDPATMQQDVRYEDVVSEVRDFLVQAADRAMAAGIARDRIWLDPGFGFGKLVEHNVALLGRLGEFVRLGFPVLVGLSRKSFLGRLAALTRAATHERSESGPDRLPDVGEAMKVSAGDGTGTTRLSQSVDLAMAGTRSVDAVEPAPVRERLAATLSAELWAAVAGAKVIRTHEPRATREALEVWATVSRSGEWSPLGARRR